MSLKRLRLRDFRCFEALDWSPGHSWNLISGENASGKTSLLEAIFFLGRGRSFRTAQVDRMVRSGADCFDLVGDIQGQRAHRLGVRRGRGQGRWRLDGEDLRRMAEIASLFPVLAVDTGAQVMIEGGPQNRRRFLDWGLFHVEPAFLPIWRRYRQAVAQRNGALRTGVDDRSLSSWDQAVAESGEALDRYRREQVGNLAGQFSVMASAGLNVAEVGLDYQPGWRKGLSLAEALMRNREADRRMGHTLSGPHRAELVVSVEGRPARERVSRGQQKMLAAALLLSGAALFETVRDRGVVVLLDDLPSELDRDHASRLGELLGSLTGQIFVTGIEGSRLQAFAPAESQLFHVEQGRLRQ